MREYLRVKRNKCLDSGKGPNGSRTAMVRVNGGGKYGYVSCGHIAAAAEMSAASVSGKPGKAVGITH